MRKVQLELPSSFPMVALAVMFQKYGFACASDFTGGKDSLAIAVTPRPDRQLNPNQLAQVLLEDRKHRKVVADRVSFSNNLWLTYVGENNKQYLQGEPFLGDTAPEDVDGAKIIDGHNFNNCKVGSIVSYCFDLAECTDQSLRFINGIGLGDINKYMLVAGDNVKEITLELINWFTAESPNELTRRLDFRVLEPTD